jgi:RNA polymerase sigma-70 factor (ECF subfamily)
MTGDDSDRIDELIRRLQHGDGTAHDELIGLTYECLRQLARAIFHRDFPRLRGQHDTDSVVNQGAARLWKALDHSPPRDARHYYRLAALQMRRVLLDLARKPDRHAGAVPADFDLADNSHDPVALAAWTEFHEAVEQLPDEEREVVDLCFYRGWDRKEAARLLHIDRREVGARWTRAFSKLPAIPQ